MGLQGNAFRKSGRLVAATWWSYITIVYHLQSARCVGARNRVADAHVQIQKKKIWEELQPDLKTGADRVAAWQGHAMRTAAGAVTADSIVNGGIS